MRVCDWRGVDHLLFDKEINLEASSSVCNQTRFLLNFARCSRREKRMWFMWHCHLITSATKWFRENRTCSLITSYSFWTCLNYGHFIINVGMRNQTRFLLNFARCSRREKRMWFMWHCHLITSATKWFRENRTCSLITSYSFWTCLNYGHFIINVGMRNKRSPSMPSSLSQKI